MRTKLSNIAVRFDAFDDELHAMRTRELTAAEASGFFRRLAGAGPDRFHTMRKAELFLPRGAVGQPPVYREIIAAISSLLLFKTRYGWQGQ